MDNTEEILRLRQRVHDLYSERRAVQLRLDLAEDQLGKLRGQVEAIMKADEIAEAVANELATRDENKSTSEKLGLSKNQFRYTVAFGVITLALGIFGNLQAAGVL